jgi:hypothetical protein
MAAAGAAAGAETRMTDHVVRLYAAALALVVFFLTWAVVAARPWAEESTAQKDPRLAALERREQRLRREAIRVNRLVERRFENYRAQLAARQTRPAAAVSAPSVGAVSLPPVTSTRSS